MANLHDKNLMESYIEKYRIRDVFTKDMTPFMNLIFFSKGEHICREGEDLDYFYFFLDGKAKVYTSLSNGKVLLLAFYEGFKVLGDVELVKSEPATSNVQVIEDTYCIGIPMEEVKNHLLEDAKFLSYVCESLAGKLNRCSKNSSINLLYPLESRLASYILATEESFDENLTEISELLGTSYRHLLRTLRSMEEKGLIEKERGTFKIKDRLALTRLASDLYME